MTPVTLEINGAIYSGWKAVQIQTGIEQLAGQFSLRCADRWAIAGQPRPILAGQRAAVKIGGTPVITGFIDETTASFSARSHDLLIAGRDATGDLVDCAAEVDGQGWKGRTLEQIAIQLCKPYGIAVQLEGEGGKALRAGLFDKSGKVSARNPFRAPRINPGETVFETLSRAAQLRGYLLVSDGIGGLRITRAAAGGRATTELRQGVNVLGGRAVNSQRERFHTYKVYGQMDEASSFEQPAAAQQQLATARDPEVRTARTSIIHTSDDTDAGSAKQLALWTAANRKAAGVRAELQVRGWLDADKPWRPNSTVVADVPWLALDGEYLVASVSFSIDDQGGELTVLDLTLPETYVPAPLREALVAA